MRKLAAILAALLLAVTLAACGSNADGSSFGTSTSDAVQEETSEGTSSETPEVEDQDLAGQTSDGENLNQELLKALTPEGATNTASLSGLMTLSSTQSIDEIKTFYMQAMIELGVEKTFEQNSVGWSFVGTYDGDKELSVSVVEDFKDNTKNTILITY